MDSSEGAKPKRHPMQIAIALIIVGLIASFSVVGYVMYLDWSAPDSAVAESIKYGDTVKMDYIGRLPDGRVFDTSLWYVAQNDVLYPKSLTFSARANDSYKEFTMTAGKTGAGGTIEGFAMGVIGLSAGTHQTIEVPSDKGYALDPNQLVTIELVQEIPATEIYSIVDFTNFYDSAPVELDQLSHFFWKWDVIVASVSEGFVTVVSQPEVGSNLYPFGNPEATANTGWEVRVTSYDPAALDGAGLIKIQHMIGPEDVFFKKGTDADGQTFVLWDYDEATGTFQIHRNDSSRGYNAEVTGRTLFFEVIINSVEPEDYYST